MSPQPDLGLCERIAHDVAAEWLELAPPFALARYSYVAPAGGDAVPKVTPPEDDEAVPHWLAEAERPTRPASELIPLARELYSSLDVGRSTLVHGDFHHHNVLDAGPTRGHQVIDPKAMLGEPEFDVPSFLWNPISYRMRLDVTERRLAAFAAAGLDERRMRAWTVIRGAYMRVNADEVEVLRALL